MNNQTNPAENDIHNDQSNWYAKLHPIGTAQQAPKRKRLLNLSIFFRIWLAVALVLVICGVVVFTQLFGYVKPTAQQVIEDTLLDTSKLLAASLQVPLSTGQLYDEEYQAQLDAAFVGMPAMGETLSPVDQTKSYSSFRVYVTDSSGIVIYDSLPKPDNNEGQNYGRWNDVYLTLKGQYGARSTLRDYQRRDGSVMYVAQPIKNPSGDIIGVVSVGKPVASVLPYLDDTRNRMLITALLISIAALILAGLVAWWLKQSITLVTQYTSALAEDTKKPYFYLGHELNSLTDTIETMKHRLENRAYVTDYVHTLTHELKSPLTAIRASSELLEDDGLDGNKLDNEDRQMLIETVGEQSVKMQQLIDRLLLLAKVEQPTFKLNRQLTPLLPLLQSLIKDNTAKQQQQNLYPIDIYIGNKNVTNIANLPAEILAATSVYADQFWLIQVLQNVLDNAIHFANRTVEISLHSTARTITIDIFNDGKLLPEYAVAKAFERYFSLSHQSQPSSQTTNRTDNNDLYTESTDPTTEPRQTDYSSNTLKKGTGLGLTLVKQVIEHHGGQVAINNVHANDDKATDNGKNQRSGVMVSITLPLA
ncbi:two-component system sensor histidine kinase CreC [uncultured Psychrobacter sp.]|uniref:two-component system sensor histidine kinase CreC n=1 Tax=uncultured Psychrobacter sp. TaxID=259303 RepID=UPI002614E8A1|nr:two-component system sensor histidine kinase CreC [uncultured Psychrobacter sp.]